MSIPYKRLGEAILGLLRKEPLIICEYKGTTGTFYQIKRRRKRGLILVWMEVPLGEFLLYLSRELSREGESGWEGGFIHGTINPDMAGEIILTGIKHGWVLKRTEEDGVVRYTIQYRRGSPVLWSVGLPLSAFLGAIGTDVKREEEKEGVVHRTYNAPPI